MVVQQGLDHVGAGGVFGHPADDLLLVTDGHLDLLPQRGRLIVFRSGREIKKQKIRDLRLVHTGSGSAQPSTGASAQLHFSPTQTTSFILQFKGSFYIVRLKETDDYNVHKHDQTCHSR